METDKVKQSERLIKIALTENSFPVILCSFGKDSIVLLDLIRKVKKDIEVIFFREPYLQKKFLHAQKVIADWDLTVYDYPPSFVNYIQFDNYFEIINFYYVDEKIYIVLYGGACKYSPEKPFLCAVYDFICRPKIDRFTFKWDCIFLAQKETDPVYIAERVKVKTFSYLGKRMLVLPLKDWTDKDIWNYIKKNNVPYDKQRYEENNQEVNPDKFPTCFDCLDYRASEEIICPKKNIKIKSIAKSEEEQIKFKNQLLGMSLYMSAY